ncbi:MAG: LysM peptidoglycan-binding domain-containing protein [Gemmatimonadales bacterium]
MRKTTIFRSSCCVLALAAWGLSSTASAQDTVAVQQGGQGGQGVHVVQEGETLWQLAERYLGDPFLWPEIYRLNTLVVEDPHWIFPGEELMLAPVEPAPPVPQPADTAQGVRRMEPDTAPVPPDTLEPLVPEIPPPPAAPPPPPPTETAPTVFMEQQSVTRTVRGELTPLQRYRPLRRGEFYAAGFLTEEQDLPWARVLGAVGKPMLGNLTATSSQRIFGEIEIEAPRGAEYRVGDSLLVALVQRDVPGWGQVVEPTGIVEVTRASGRQVIARIVQQFGRVADGQVALPLEPFRDPGWVTPVPVEDGLRAHIIVKRNPQPIAGQQDVVFIDAGRQDGVSVGDVFEVIRQVSGGSDEEPAWERVAVMNIVHVRERSASGILLEIAELGADAGAAVRLLRKMPS